MPKYIDLRFLPFSLTTCLNRLLPEEDSLQAWCKWQGIANIIWCCAEQVSKNVGKGLAGSHGVKKRVKGEQKQEL